jgi:hypothetical protein
MALLIRHPATIFLISPATNKNFLTLNHIIARAITGGGRAAGVLPAVVVRPWPVEYASAACPTPDPAIARRTGRGDGEVCAVGAVTIRFTSPGRNYTRLANCILTKDLGASGRTGVLGITTCSAGNAAAFSPRPTHAMRAEILGGDVLEADTSGRTGGAPHRGVMRKAQQDAATADLCQKRVQTGIDAVVPIFAAPADGNSNTSTTAFQKRNSALDPFGVGSADRPGHPGPPQPCNRCMAQGGCRCR